METFHIIAVFIILVATFACFVKEWLPVDLAALAAFALCMLLGMLDADDVAAVFNNSAPLTIGAMFVLSAALNRTGVIDRMAILFTKAAKGSELRALVILALLVAPLSACVNNTPIVIVFLPVLISFARSANLKASRLLMPLSFIAILGGTMCIFGTSTNILVSGVSAKEGLEPFGVFEILPLGVIYALVGVIYLLTVGRKLMPSRDTVSSLFGSDDLRDFTSSAVVPEGSPLEGKKLSESDIWENPEFRIYYVVRNGQRLGMSPLDELVLHEGDTVVLKASTRGVSEIAESGSLSFYKAPPTTERKKIKLVEAMIGPHSNFIGKKITQLDLRSQYGIVVAALHRKGVNLTENVGKITLQFGDTLLIEAPESNLQRFENTRTDIIFLNDEVERPFRRKKAIFAMAAIVCVVLASSLGVPILTSAIVGAVAVMVIGCVDPREAYNSIEWPILFIIYGMLGLGAAMENTGAVRMVAENIAGGLNPFGPLVVLAVMYLLSSALTEVVTNNAVAILITPIVISIAEGMGVDARPFVVAVMFGASASFATPIGYQTNTYVFGAGGYRFSDFVKVGLPLNLLLWIIAIIFIPIFWPF
ncbi:sodium:sulfate symporter [Oceaniferula spumae]|uniref:Sodium:sulfate symporter n=1 Tax=Oceaniferula spumae TaxID=2979115 RepID=A0AAT9FP37_9BACT